MKVAIFAICVLTLVLQSECFPHLEIINGDVADIVNFPYVVSISSAGQYICVGSIVTPKYILTAAHCVDQISELGVRAGSSSRSSGGQTPDIAKVHIYSAYSPIFITNDIAIIELATELTLGDDVATIPLSNNTEVRGGESGAVTGWGATSVTNGHLPDDLRNATVPVFNDKDCLAVYGGFYTTSQICAGGEEDTCQGDSGSPLVVDGLQVGISSFGFKSCGVSPSIYVRVAAYRSLFIDDVINS